MDDHTPHQPPDLVVSPRPSRLNALLIPPLIVIVLALVLLVIRVRTSDWYWPSSSSSSLPPPQITQAKPAPQAPRVPQKHVSPQTPRLAQAEPSAEEPEPKSEPKPAPFSANKSPQPPQVAQTQDDIEKEAARIRAEREELERIKKAEGERLAKLPPKPRAEHPDPAQVQALMRAEMKRMQRDLEAMMNRMPPGFGPMPPLARGGRAFPGLPPEIERQFQDMERRHQEFLRQAEQRMRNQRNNFAVPPQFPRPNRPPNVRSFRFSSPDGRIQGFQIHLKSTTSPDVPLNTL